MPTGARRRLAPVTMDLSPLSPKGLPALLTDLLAAAAQRDLPVLDENLYLDVFAQPTLLTQRRAASCR